MKKKEILEIIKNKKTIENSILLPLEHDCGRCCDQRLFDKLIENYDELKKQYQEDIKAKQEYNKFRNSHVCNHQIRQLVYDDESNDFSVESFYECVFCKHSIPKNKNQANWFQSDYYDNCVYVENEHFNVLDFLIDVLNLKDDLDEIDFIEEFKKLNLDSNIFTINDAKRCENYIMIISSSLDNISKISPNELIFLDKISHIIGIKVLLFLSGAAKWNIPSSLLSKSNIHLETDKFKLYEIEQKNISIKTIINLSPNLIFHNKTIYKNVITITQKLKELFPTSQLINLTELNSQAIDEIATYIEKITNDSKQLDNSDNQYVKKLVR